VKTPTPQELNRQFLPTKLGDLAPEHLRALRDHSKRMFGNQDRLEVAVAITRVERGRINATDLHREIDVAVNRIRNQLLVMEDLRLLQQVGVENGKRVFEVCNRSDPFWKFAVHECKAVMRQVLEADLPRSRRRTREKIR
jgi:Fe2+ or Zn2+ uptake regulation protein